MGRAPQVKTSEFHVYERNLYEMPQRQPLTNGVLDRRLGTSDKKGECATCHGKLQECAGHFGTSLRPFSLFTTAPAQSEGCCLERGGRERSRQGGLSAHRASMLTHQPFQAPTLPTNVS
jgi:hypothetical protein